VGPVREKSPSGGRKDIFRDFSEIFGKRSAVGYLLRFGKGTVELILRDWKAAWLNQGRRMVR
jgi:hypothetical protein